MEKKEKEKLKRMNVPVSTTIHAQIKYFATMRNMKTSDYVNMAVVEWVKRENLTQ